MAKMESHSEKGEMKADKKQDVALIKKAFKQHDKQQSMKGLKKGGPTSPDMMKYGRNMARAMNQGSK